MSDIALENDGYCTICEAPTHFSARYDWLRDHYRCTRCESLPRERALMLALATSFPDWRRLRIHESSPGMPSSAKLARECRRYVATHFFPHVRPGRAHRGFRCEDLAAMTFDDASFDLVVTQDVLEHVMDPEAAFREVARTLRPGGAHVFTVPIQPGLARSERRAWRDEATGEIRHAGEPEFHGNPIDEQGSLVTMHYGADLARWIDRASGTHTRVLRVADAHLGLLGEFLEVGLSYKPSPARPFLVP